MKTLILGGAGFIGSNVAAHRLALGDDVTVFDNCSRDGAIKNIDWLREQYPNLRIIYGDIRYDIDRLRRAIQNAEIVYHLAAQVAVTTSVTDPREDFEINALGSFNVLEAARTAGNNPILIYSSTNKVYGGMEDERIILRNHRYDYKYLLDGASEDRPLDFHSPYGCSKGAADQYFRDYARIFSLRTVVFRQSCIYGERQFGVEDQGWVAWFAIAALTGKPITIYGDGKQVRDVLHVRDLIKAYDLAIENIEVVSGRIYNIGGGRLFTMSLLELINHLEEILGQRIPCKYAGWRPGDQRVYISNIQLAKRDLGWIPQIDQKSGVRMLVNWVNENKKLFGAPIMSPTRVPNIPRVSS